jgi:hypothetical protein
MDYKGSEVLLRVVSTNNVDEDEQADLVFYHCYRSAIQSVHISSIHLCHISVHISVPYICTIQSVHTIKH